LSEEEPEPVFPDPEPEDPFAEEEGPSSPWLLEA